MNLKEFEEIYVSEVPEIEKFCFFTRGLEFQEEAVEILERLLDDVASIKDSLVQIRDEPGANKCLFYQSGLLALLYELKMWICLKTGNEGKAWEHLVISQNHSENCIVLVKDNRLINYRTKLHRIEKVLFPPPFFSSFGAIVERNTCSICKEDYNKCAHIKGQPYMGEFCVEIIEKLNLKEVSIVENPANKMARVTKIGNRDFLTWRIDDSSEEE